MPCGLKFAWSVPPGIDSASMFERKGFLSFSEFDTNCFLSDTTVGQQFRKSGPVKNPGGVCSKGCLKNQKAIQCDDCDVWFHTKCFNCSNVVFSGKNRNIIYPILNYSTKYVIFCHVHVFFPTDFAGFCEILLIARSCAIFGRNREIPEGL